MKHIYWKILLSIVLVSSSILLHLLHYAIFRDNHHIAIYLLGDLAFLPISILFVTLVVDQVMKKQEKYAMFRKLNMVIGAFFSETGTELLRIFRKFDNNPEYLADSLIFNKDWKQKEYYEVKKKLNNYKPVLDMHKGDIEYLKKFLGEKREFLLRLLENPNLLEHETFTALLWSVFHLTEELCARPDFKHLPESDYEHLENDIKRAYSLLIVEWIVYMRHLHNSYPYLFSLAVRTNPFDIKASIIIKNK